MKKEYLSLPESLHRLERMIGVEACLKLVERYGGRNVYVPVLGHCSQNLRELIGTENERVLSEMYGGTLLYIPVCREYRNAKRNQKIIAARREGKSVQRIAETFKLSERWVRKILQEQRNGRSSAY